MKKNILLTAAIIICSMQLTLAQTKPEVAYQQTDHRVM